MCLASERRRYYVTSFVSHWLSAYTKMTPAYSHTNLHFITILECMFILYSQYCVAVGSETITNSRHICYSLYATADNFLHPFHLHLVQYWSLKITNVLANGANWQIPTRTCFISHNTPDWNKNVHISVPKWCNLGYMTGALWDLKTVLTIGDI